jgi:hypothetical protein
VAAQQQRARSWQAGRRRTDTLTVARSTDGGSSWAKQILVKNTASSSGISGLLSGQSGCTIRTDSTGKVYVFWSGFDKKTKTQGIYLATSADGGSTYSTPRRLFTTVHTGVLDPVLGRFTMDGIAGARDDLSNAPSADIANGAPTGADATNQILLSWVDGKFGLNHEPVLLSASANGGRTWTTPRKIDGTGKRRPSRPMAPTSTSPTTPGSSRTSTAPSAPPATAR